MKKLGVKVKLGEEFTAATIKEMKPDAVVVAVGGTPFVPDIPGIKRSNVVSGAGSAPSIEILFDGFSAPNF